MVNPVKLSNKTHTDVYPDSDSNKAASYEVRSGKVTQRVTVIADDSDGGSGLSGYKTYEDSSFVVGDSPVVHDINTDLGRNSTTGYLANTGSGALLAEISEDGATYEDQFTVGAGATVTFEDDSIDSLRLTHSADTSYSVRVK